jgi:hypothetical protein
MALAWWLVPCFPFPGLLHIYFLFTVRLTNERVGVLLARRSVQHLVNVDMQCCILFAVIRRLKYELVFQFCALNDIFDCDYICTVTSRWNKTFFFSLSEILVFISLACLPFPGLLHIYFLFTVRLTNERVGVLLARRSVQHLVNVDMQCCIFSF